MNSLELRIEQGPWRSQKEQSEAARRLLCSMLGEELAVEHNTDGAPYLPQRPDLHISISHCRTAVAVAVSPEGRVGIDVECRRRVGEDLMKRVCTADELAAVQASDDPTMTFLQLWTRKEAVLKMRGTGIQGFGNMVDALSDKSCHVMDLETRIPDVVASLVTGV